MKKARAVQVSRPGGPFEMVEREIPSQDRAKFVSKCKPAACATAMR